MKSVQSKFQLPQPRPTVARIVFALTLGTAIAVSMYLWVGRRDPVPSWIAVPMNASLAESRVNPNGTVMPGAVEYYLQVVVPGADVKSELRKFAGCVERVEWRELREMNKDDAFVRLGYPSWVKDHMVQNRPMEGAWRLESKGSQEQIDLFGWPGDAGKCIIELVMKTGGLSEPEEDPTESEIPE